MRRALRATRNAAQRRLYAMLPKDDITFESAALQDETRDEASFEDTTLKPWD